MATHQITTICPECNVNEVDAEITDEALRKHGFSIEIDLTAEEVNKMQHELNCEVPICQDCGCENPYRDRSHSKDR